ncbi:hypothetical protein FACS189497_04470 [Betaproteobacteria bacterium]|nr:hypothetical protein FACS189497_04470 [Betaproteobacteria bacterium]
MQVLPLRDPLTLKQTFADIRALNNSKLAKNATVQRLIERFNELNKGKTPPLSADEQQQVDALNQAIQAIIDSDLVRKNRAVVGAANAKLAALRKKNPKATFKDVFQPQGDDNSDMTGVSPGFEEYQGAQRILRHNRERVAALKREGGTLLQSFNNLAYIQARLHGYAESIKPAPVEEKDDLTPGKVPSELTHERYEQLHPHEFDDNDTRPERGLLAYDDNPDKRINRDADGVQEGGAGAYGMVGANVPSATLTPEQLRVARSPEFKKWFGDWEALVKQNEFDALVEASFSQKDPRGRMTFREVTPEEVREVLRQDGPDISGMVHEITAEELRHAMKRHGESDEATKNPGHRPLTKADLKNVLAVIDAPTEMTVKPAGNNRTSILYGRDFGNGKVEYVERVFETSAKNKPRLSTKTVWVRDAATGAETSPPRVSTPYRNSRVLFANGRVKPTPFTTLHRRRQADVPTRHRQTGKAGRGCPGVAAVSLPPR